MLTICVADLVINIESSNEAFFCGRYKAYECAFCPNPDMHIKIEIVDSITAPQGELCFQKNSAWLLKLEDGRFCRYLKRLKTDEIMLCITYSSDYSDVYLKISKKLNQSNMSITDYEYIYTGFMFSNRLTTLGGSVLHGSSIVFDGEGIVFSANSGTGKSTHVGLWRQRFGNRVEVINDDKPALKIENGRAFIYGTPWSGKTSLNTNIKCPLKAVAFISRSKKSAIKKMDVLNAVLNFSNQLPNPFYDSEIGAKTVDFIKKLYEVNIPVYDLSCDISEDAVDVAFGGIFKGENL